MILQLKVKSLDTYIKSLLLRNKDSSPTQMAGKQDQSGQAMGSPYHLWKLQIYIESLASRRTTPFGVHRI